MTIKNLNDLRLDMQCGHRLLGLDLGTKKIGVAISDINLCIASPFLTINRTKFDHDAKKLLKLIKDENVSGLIIGLPINMDGSEGRQCQSTRQFANNMLKITDLSIAFWDERLSTSAIERILINEADMSRARRAAVVDKMAAAFILQGALDSLKNLSTLIK